MRAAERLTGRAAPDAPQPFATRPFGTSAAEAAAVAAAAARALTNYPSPTVAGDPNPSLQAGGRVSGATGGSGSNLTTSASPLVSPTDRNAV